ncbi:MULTISPECIES: cytochrome-c oxidase, cbb3-type subunit III [Grimontia]|uniref:Cbb3-type cytochrome c oxidase subunit n=1 Tax=Grimontia marina TaxID=646534 RepID=A0A128EZF7_9GAMM|nr:MULTISPECIES: cytochrome-c oxidase, cbb3-type subunit III [Grimontia]WRV98232.1 cytochrome-c oxidase, cbb3-type subunit III [Grimontia sp. NTOU-MAR1]CZF79396.1 Cbb3-type cytochrome c oxidase subunit CcoP2 [Grimontia marina]
MTTFWSLFITVITIGTLVGCAALIIWCGKDLDGVADGEDMGHEYDGIRELNNPLPKWWSYMFWATIVFGAVYFVLYPGLGNWKGVFNWQSSAQDVANIEESRQRLADSDVINQYARELTTANAIFGETYRKLAYKPGSDELLEIAEIAKNPEAIKVGQRLFIQNCAQCHGSDARGQSGFPNLTDKAWLYGGEPDTIKATILHGRVGNMPSWIDALGDDGVREVASYTLSLSGRKVDAQEAAKGKTRFVVCAACHGTDGKGNPAFGAPDLTDNVWLFGGSRKAVEETIRYGRQGVMPAWKDILDEDKIQLLSAYVWQLGTPQNQ